MEGKFWCFTLNNYTKDDVKQLKNFECSYMVFGKEIGEQGTKHLQGYCEFETNRKRKRLSKFNERIHWEKRRGTSNQASDYCKKDGKYFEKGTLSSPLQGKRTDIDEIKDMVNEGKRMKDIVMVARSVQSVRMAEIMLKYAEPKRDWFPNVYWYWGETGSGKTKRAFEKAGNDCWVSGKNLKWWEGYDAHENIIIDDFRKDFCTFHELLRILDCYEYRVECKGGSRQLLAKNIWITSCYPPDEVYDTREDIKQLLRRITKIRHIKK